MIFFILIWLFKYYLIGVNKLWVKRFNKSKDQVKGLVFEITDITSYNFTIIEVGAYHDIFMKLFLYFFNFY